MTFKRWKLNDGNVPTNTCTRLPRQLSAGGYFYFVRTYTFIQYTYFIIYKLLFSNGNHCYARYGYSHFFFLLSWHHKPESNKRIQKCTSYLRLFFYNIKCVNKFNLIHLNLYLNRCVCVKYTYIFLPTSTRC